jgi:hypothetical protein
VIISIINHTNGKISDEEVQGVLRAVNRHVKVDFEPYWNLGATLRPEGKAGKKPKEQEAADMRSDAIIYFWDSVNVDDALGYHDTKNRSIPFGSVFIELSKQLGENWTVTLSHEALDLIGDAEVNLLVAGPHPSNCKLDVFHWYEMCDAVQAEVYKIDDVEVSNIVLSLYFTGGEEVGRRNDFIVRSHNGKTLRSFGVNPGGYVGFFNLQIGVHDTFAAKAMQRLSGEWRSSSAPKPPAALSVINASEQRKSILHKNAPSHSMYISGASPTIS